MKMKTIHFQVDLVCIFCVLSCLFHHSECQGMLKINERRQLADVNKGKRCVPPCTIFHNLCRNDGKCREKSIACTWYCECPANCEGIFCEIIKTEKDTKGDKIVIQRPTKPKVSNFNITDLEHALKKLSSKKNIIKPSDNKKPDFKQAIERMVKDIKIGKTVTAASATLPYCPPETALGGAILKNKSKVLNTRATTTPSIYQTSSSPPVTETPRITSTAITTNDKPANNNQIINDISNISPLVSSTTLHIPKHDATPKYVSVTDATPGIKDNDIITTDTLSRTVNSKQTTTYKDLTTDTITTKTTHSDKSPTAESSTTATLLENDKTKIQQTKIPDNTSTVKSNKPTMTTLATVIITKLVDIVSENRNANINKQLKEKQPDRISEPTKYTSTTAAAAAATSAITTTTTVTKTGNTSKLPTTVSMPALKNGGEIKSHSRSITANPEGASKTKSKSTETIIKVKPAKTSIKSEKTTPLKINKLPNGIKPAKTHTTIQPIEIPIEITTTIQLTESSTTIKPTDTSTTIKKNETPTTVKVSGTPTTIKTTETPTTIKTTETPTTIKTTETPTTIKTTESPTTIKTTKTPTTIKTTETQTTVKTTETPTTIKTTEIPTTVKTTIIPTTVLAVEKTTTVKPSKIPISPKTAKSTSTAKPQTLTTLSLKHYPTATTVVAAEEKRTTFIKKTAPQTDTTTMETVTGSLSTSTGSSTVTKGTTSPDTTVITTPTEQTSLSVAKISSNNKQPNAFTGGGKTGNMPSTLTATVANPMAKRDTPKKNIKEIILRLLNNGNNVSMQKSTTKPHSSTIQSLVTQETPVNKVNPTEAISELNKKDITQIELDTIKNKLDISKKQLTNMFNEVLTNIAESKAARDNRLSETVSTTTRKPQ